MRGGAFLEEPGLVCKYDSLDAVAEDELLQDVRDVSLDGRLADVKVLPDLCVGQAADNERKDILLSYGELVQLFRGAGRGMRVNCLITRLVIAVRGARLPRRPCVRR